LLISGTPDIDVDEWRGATEYNGYAASDPVIVWWWRALKSFNRDERAKLLSFATGSSARGNIHSYGRLNLHTQEHPACPLAASLICKVFKACRDSPSTKPMAAQTVCHKHTPVRYLLFQQMLVLTPYLRRLQPG